MHATFTLFRIEMAAPCNSPLPPLLTNELQRSLLDARLNSYLLKSGPRQQAYVALAACPGCSAGRCRPGCRVELLRRWLPFELGSRVHLRPVHTFSRRPYRRALLLRAGPQAAALTSQLLAAWPEARLSLAWQPRERDGFPLQVLLHTGSSSAAGDEVLLAHGWTVEPVEVTAHLEQQPATRWVAEPFLLVPALPDEVRPATSQVDAEELQQRHARLSAILAGTFAVSRPVPTQTIEPVDPVALWPAGPGSGGNAMHAADVEALVSKLCASDETGATGIKRRRLLPLLAERHKEHAAALCCWLDQAGVLADPVDPAQPWVQPRPLTICEPVSIAQRLGATPLPDEAALAAARAGGL